MPRLDVIGVIVPDLERSIDFYRRLGLEFPEDPDPEGTAYVPANTGVELSVTENGRTDAVGVPPQAFPTTAELDLTSTGGLPFECPKGLVCRIGTPWLTATIPGMDSA